MVLDASIAVAWFATEAGSQTALALLRSLRRLIAPDFLPLEVANAMWKKYRRREMSPADIDQSMATLFALGIEWFPARDVVTEAGRLGRDIDRPIYDCVYLVLARLRDVPLATLDQRLVRAARATQTRLYALKGSA